MVYYEELELDGKKYSIETGKLAKQADGAAVLRLGDTIVLVTAVGATEENEDLSFFPLTVDYREKAYSVGKIPGGFFKREGRPSENEILSARLIDRSIRPLFDEDFKNEVQILVSVLSADKENDPDVLGITGASIALILSDIPFTDPIAGVRVGMIDGELVLNPPFSQLENSDLDLVISATHDSIVMVEGEANEISESDMLEALKFGHEKIRELLQLQTTLGEKAGKTKREIVRKELPKDFGKMISENARKELVKILDLKDKKERQRALKSLAQDLTLKAEEQYPDYVSNVRDKIQEIEKEIVRNKIVKEGKRIDDRGLDDIRQVTCEVGVLPRVHGSALFTRGQTQALATTTLGTKMDEQKMDELEGEFWKSYMLHYNFPPFSVGEIRPMRGTSRREIGHGYLAERSLKPALPADGVFPYTIRIVSDILESNGSSSMATVCAGTLSLMDAGVPLKTPIAGIAMGLIKEKDDFYTLTDILGDEDHLGDMDFKVAGSAKGITGFQMDVKLKGIPADVMADALEKAKTARIKILEVMNQAIDKPREDLSPYAPRISYMKVAIDQIGLIIGPGGKTIRDITEKSGATINIEDDGTIIIATTEEEASKKAREMIEYLIQEPVPGQTYVGKVKKITNFGAFVEILPGKEGLLHISEIEHHRINRVEDVLKVGEEVEVKVLSIDGNGKLDLSRKALLKKT
ncbi:polyribonucleotide nucleotidyltransferase [candidate division KSB1 bacterium]|nr:polyribonucleotide nucleotidyltransferase [candidate division KSB1 bacterium]NIR70414.1 polyribonucleotide nucleotidyltransferase [candidate division KSB1 bacterium]NIS25954.1 polyribonucleotide nucleotidyltransferase [candidate division KSB1 bacterium]NIT69977.1 polyribonucleotide nucleotidyltransferase [candidate division KSB1 bacterium]NIU26642.1 polyribonucleotide nucleotidyltransferase [candidate division KSB1 bacterium]